MQRSMPGLANITNLYRHDYIFNIDEFGHVYFMIPDRTIDQMAMPRIKSQIVRLTYLACCNATGMERMPLMMIGRARRPILFMKESGSDRGFDYYNNKKSWMTSSLFFQWLRRFASFIFCAEEDRKVQIIIYSCPAHRSRETIQSFHNVEVAFLPPNTTSKLQPLDAGKMTRLKDYYRFNQYGYEVDLTDSGMKYI